MKLKGSKTAVNPNIWSHMHVIALLCTIRFELSIISFYIMYVL